MTTFWEIAAHSVSHFVLIVFCIICAHYPDAKIDTVCDKIKLFNLSEFRNIIVYVGGNNAMNNLALNDSYKYFEERLDKFITYIKRENSECNIFIYNMCPRGDKNVSTINEIILRQCETHNVTLVDAYHGFFDKRNQLRRQFFNPRDNVHLSRAWSRRLLGAINEKVEVVDDFAYCAYNDNSRNQAADSSGPVRRSQSVNSGRSVQTARGSHDNMHNGWQQQRTSNRTSRRNADEADRIHDRCLKCGLKNHSTSDCHHKNQIKCRNCSFYGHKDYNCRHA